MKNKKSTIKIRFIATILVITCIIGTIFSCFIADTIEIDYSKKNREAHKDEMVTSMDIYKTIDTTVKTFPDVSYKNWFFENVTQAVQMGFLNGYDDGTYKPTESITRAQICQILYNCNGNGAKSTSNISDVESYRWYYTPVSWAVNNGLISTHSNGKFEANTALTREELVYSLYALAGKPNANISVLNSFSDKNNFTSTDYKNAFAWAVNNGIVNGTTTTTLEPKATTTRAQVATVMIRYASKINGNEIPVIDSAILNGSKNLNGSTNATYVNSVSSVGKSNSYPTIGQADTANANGYFTEADVDIEGAVLCYDALDYIHQALGNYGLVWTTCDEMEEYTLMRAKEIYEQKVADNWEDLRTESGTSIYHDRPDGSYAAMTENLAWAATEDGSGTTKRAVTNWLNSSGHLAQMKYTSAECCVARYKNVWVYTVTKDTSCMNPIVYAGNNYYYNTWDETTSFHDQYPDYTYATYVERGFVQQYPYFAYVGLM